VRYIQKQHRQSRTVTEEWVQTWPVPKLDTFEPDLEEIDKVLSETEE
jgi:hypothetical protein